MPSVRVENKAIQEQERETTGKKTKGAFVKCIFCGKLLGLSADFMAWAVFRKESNFFGPVSLHKSLESLLCLWAWGC